MWEIEQDVAGLDSALKPNSGHTSDADSASIGAQRHVDDEFVLRTPINGQVVSRG